MTAFDAFHLPGFDPSRAGAWSELEAGPARIRYPRLSATQLHDIADVLRRNALAHLRTRSVHDVIRAVDGAARRLAGPGELRELALALLPATTRFSEPMVRLILDRMAGDWREETLARVVAVELGDAAVLDGFVDDSRAGRRVRALGPELVLNVFAGNVPGVSVTALVRCLLVKSAVLGKTGTDDPVLPVLFARALAEVDAELGSCVAVTYWRGGDSEAEDAALEAADAVVVYGGADAVRNARLRARADARVIEHGPRMSVGFVAREALTKEGAGALARDVALAAATFDQHGCVSLHGAFVERGGAVEPRAFAGLIHEQLLRLERDLPAGRLSAEEAVRLHAERARVEFALMESGGEVLAATGAGATVVYAEAADATPSCLDRFVRVSAVDQVADALAPLQSVRGLLQTAALAAGPDRSPRLAEELAAAGFTRITSFREMPWPPAHWHHDGAAPLGELVRWIDLETTGQ